MDSGVRKQDARVDVENTLIGHNADIEKGGLRLSMYSGSPAMVFIPTLFAVFFILPLALAVSYWQNAPNWAIVVSVVTVAVVLLSLVIVLGVWWGKRTERRQKIVDEFLEKNHFLPLPSDLFTYLREELSKHGLTQYEKTELANTWHLPADIVHQIDPLSRFISWASASFVGPSAQSTHDAYLQMSGNRRLVAVTEIINYNWSWVVIIPLKAPSSIASVYVSVSGMGDNYYDKDDEVDVASLGGRYHIFTGKGGGSDAYYLSDKLNLASVDPLLLPFDFEVYNKMLILRQPMANISQVMLRRHGQKELFHPEVMEQVVREANYLLSRLDLGGSYPFTVEQLAVTDRDTAWTQRVRPSQAMIRRAGRLQNMKLVAAFFSATAVLLAVVFTIVYLHDMFS